MRWTLIEASLPFWSNRTRQVQRLYQVLRAVPNQQDQSA